MITCLPTFRNVQFEKKSKNFLKQFPCFLAKISRFQPDLWCKTTDFSYFASLQGVQCWIPTQKIDSNFSIFRSNFDPRKIAEKRPLWQVTCVKTYIELLKGYSYNHETYSIYECYETKFEKHEYCKKLKKWKSFLYLKLVIGNYF